MSLDELRTRLAEICRRHLDSDATELLLGLARPAIRLAHAAPHSGRSSRLGGLPQLAVGAAWPQNSRRKPLDLLCVIDLEELAEFETDMMLPASGLINVFYDCAEQPWGSALSDQEGWAVIWSTATSVADVSVPEGVVPFRSVELIPTQTLTIPGWEESAVEAIFPSHSDRSPEAVTAREKFLVVDEEWRAVIGDAKPIHQMGGWPCLQQAPIWQDCDLVPRGYDRGPSEWELRRQNRSVGRESEWSLLFQIDTDDAQGWMWGDVGMLYFACRRPVDRHGSPLSSWMVLQCG